jgi:two-component system, LytTR family, response regulator
VDISSLRLALFERFNAVSFMQILILEDEPLVAQNLQKMVAELLPHATMLGPLVSVESAIQWLNTQPEPDLILSDIQLSDGVSFDVFQEIQPLCPLIFTTAYDEYAIRAFKLNSIDYLLKPIDKEELRGAFDKFKRWQSNPEAAQIPQRLRALLLDLGSRSVKKYKQRFIAHHQRAVIAIPENRVAYFLREEVIWLFTVDNQRLITDYQSLDELEELLDPARFFRANRQYIVRKESLQSYRTHHTGKLELTLCVPVKDDCTISKDKASLFRSWFED